MHFKYTYIPHIITHTVLLLTHNGQMLCTYLYSVLDETNPELPKLNVSKYITYKENMCEYITKQNYISNKATHTHNF